MIFACSAWIAIGSGWRVELIFCWSCNSVWSYILVPTLEEPTSLYLFRVSSDGMQQFTLQMFV